MLCLRGTYQYQLRLQLNEASTLGLIKPSQQLTWSGVIVGRNSAMAVASNGRIASALSGTRTYCLEGHAERCRTANVWGKWIVSALSTFSSPRFGMLNGLIVIMVRGSGNAAMRQYLVLVEFVNTWGPPLSCGAVYAIWQHVGIAQATLVARAGGVVNQKMAPLLISAPVNAG